MTQKRIPEINYVTHPEKINRNIFNSIVSKGGVGKTFRDESGFSMHCCQELETTQKTKRNQFLKISNLTLLPSHSG